MRGLREAYQPLMSSAIDFWDAVPPASSLNSEANIEHRLVLPLLHALGYESDDIESKYPVEFQQGRVGRKPAADFVCFYGVLRDRTNSLLVVEAKAFGEALPPGKVQGESYAQNLRAPLLVLTNGETLEIWQMQISLESECVFSAPIDQLASKRGLIEKLLNKNAVRDYCAALKFKTIIEATADFGDYETAELKRLKSYSAAINRTLLVQATAAPKAPIDSNRLLAEYASGAVIVGPSGYGKSTLARSILQQAIEERWRGTHEALSIDAPLPDLEQTGEALLTFLHRRVNAHQPGLRPHSFADVLRESGATIVCDSLDRTSYEFQKRFATEVTLFLRDYPLSQVFILSRSDRRPMVALQVLELMPLSDDQMRELEEIILNDGSTKHYSIMGAAPPTLRALCNNPLLLGLSLEYWKRERRFPEQIDMLFRSWLNSVLETEPNDLVSRTNRERALAIIAEATEPSPIRSIRAIALLRSSGVPDGILNELIQCNALRETDTVLEVQHEGLADYLRAKLFAERSVAEQISAIPSLSLTPNSFFPVLLMSQLADRDAQNALWKHLVSGPMSIYMDALRYRIDASEEMKKLEIGELSLRYLTDLLNGIDEPLDGFFPEFRPPVSDWLTNERSKPLAVIGTTNGVALHYKIYSRDAGLPRVEVGTPDFPGTIRGVDFAQSRFRTDSARLLGTTLLKSALRHSIEALDINAGPLWAAERTMARVRLLSRRYGFEFNENDDLSVIAKAISPYADQRIDDGPLVGKERFSFQSILDDIQVIRSAGLTALDVWWDRLGWKDDISVMSDNDLSRVLDEEYRRVQLTYAEIVRSTLSRFADDLLYYPILPIRWKLQVKRRAALDRTFVIFPRWTPVQSWEDAGADVTFTDTAPVRYPDWEEARNALIALGRPPNIPRYGGFTTHFGYDGTTLTGYFSGATPVANEITAWLKEELERMFRNLPSGDGAYSVF